MVWPMAGVEALATIWLHRSTWVCVAGMPVKHSIPARVHLPAVSKNAVATPLTMHADWVGMVAEVTFENGKCGADNFRFVRHNAGYETIFCRPADETEVLGDLAARSKTRGAALTANGDRVRVAP